MKTVRRIVVGLLALGLLAIGTLVAVGAALHEARPETGLTGPEADTLARTWAGHVNLEAWARTGAVRWNFGGRQTHLWDRERNLSRVTWGDVVVLQHTDRRVGRVWVEGVEVHGDERAALVQQAWGYFINDAFWLNPFETLFNDDVTRSVVQVDGEPALLVEYGSGGVTPGDAYLWLAGEPGAPPRAWKMWVGILPIGGIEVPFEGWTELSTGALASTNHPFALGPTLKLTEVAGAATLAALEPGDDPFEALVNW